MAGIHLKQRLGTAVFQPEVAAALAFLLSLVLIEPLVLSVSYRWYLINLQQHEYARALGVFLVIFASFAWAAVFFWSSFSSTVPARFVYFTIFVIAVLVEYGYQHAFGRFTNVEDLRIAMYDATAEQWRGSILAYFDWRAVVPCLMYAVGLFTIRKKHNRSWKTMAVVLVVIIAFYSAISPYVSGQFATISLNAFFRTVIISPWKLFGGYRGPREALTFRSDKSPQNNIIMVVDESVRGDHLSLNGYPRETVPYLDELQKSGILHNWGIASSGTTCSTSSHNLILVGMQPSEFPDPNYQVRKRPSIFQYAKAMGYQTHLLDGQKESFWLGTADDRKYVDDWQTASRFNSPNAYDRDVVVARKIAEIIDSSPGHFILVVKRGIHYPYAAHFPASESQWRPTESFTSDMYQLDPARREELVNAYDNAVRYNLESFFRALDIRHRRYSNVFVYTSDHGQTLSEHGERHTHCRTSMLTFPTEANVPLFLITLEPLSTDTRYRASHSNILPTLLDLMNFPKAERHYSYDLSLFEARESDSKARYFFVGDLNNNVVGSTLAFDK